MEWTGRRGSGGPSIVARHRRGVWVNNAGISDRRDAAWRHWKPHYRGSRCLTGQIRSERFALPTLQSGLLGFRLSSLFHLSFLFWIHRKSSNRKLKAEIISAFPNFGFLSFYPPAGPSGIAPLGTALWSLLLLGLEGLLCSAPTVEGAIRFSNSSTFI